MDSFDFFGFGDITIPCRNEVVLTLLELKGPNQYSIRVPCVVGKLSMDFKLSATKMTFESEPVSVNPTDMA